ncbi:MAG: M16 family metallopeptidase [Thermoanaerobaculia bacterium]
MTLRKPVRPLCALLLLSLAPVLRAAGTAEPVPRVTFEKYTLPNGLQVILHVDRKLPIVHVNEWFHVGSKNEKPGRTGFAHLFEHLMFEGSKDAPGKYLAFAEKLGANLRQGGVNGTTNPDRTNYFITVPAGGLERVLWLESDRVATLMDFLTKENLDHQRDVVKNERRQGLENTPYGRAFKLIFESVFPAGHPYSWLTIGSQEDLSAATFDDVKEFFKTYYTPNNLSLIVAGDFDPADAKRLVEKYFGPIPPGPALDRPGRFVPTLSGEKVVEVADRVPQERVYVAFPSPPFFEKGDAELDLASLILTDGLSSRLQKALVYDHPLCSTVTAAQNSSEISGLFFVSATARPGVALAEVERVVTDEIASLAKEGPTAAELNRAKAKYEFQFVSGLEGIGGFGGKSDQLNRYNTFLGDPGKLAEDLGRYQHAAPADVRAAVAKWIDTPNRVLVRFHPETSGRASAAALDRSKEPPPAPDAGFRPPDVRTATLPNGLEIFVVERPELPKVVAALAVRAGIVGDPAGKDGTATLMAQTAALGTKTRKALEIEDALGGLGTSLATNAGREFSTLEVSVLKRNLASAVDLLADVALNPTFPAEEVERERKRLLDGLAQDSKNPGALAGRIRPMLVFGREHPYGRPARGLPGTVAKIGREDLASFHATYFKPKGSAFILTGDITLAEATELARKAFGSWAGGAPPSIPIPPPRPAPAGKVYIVDRQDAAQTVVAQFVPGPDRKTPDFDALTLADAVWGGGFSGRLNLNLREDKGYSYGAFSNPALYREAGLWTGGAGVQTNKTKESVVEVVKEFKYLAGEKPISEKELEDARANRIRGYAQKFETLENVANSVAETWGYGLPMTDLARQPQGLAKTSLAEVNAAAKKYAVEAKSNLLLVGDLAKIEPGVKELNVGEIVRLDAEGNVVALK